MHITKGRLLLLAAMVVAFTALVSWGMAAKIQADSRAEIAAVLNAELGLTRQALRSWLKEHQTAAKVWADAPEVRVATAQLLAVGPDVRTLRDHAAQVRLRALLKRPQTTKGYLGYFLIGPDNTNLASSRDGNVGNESLLVRQSEFLERVRSGRTAASVPQESDVPLPDSEGRVREGVPTMFVGAPVIDTEGRVVAVFAFRLDIYSDFTTLFRQSRVGSSGETYAFDRHGHLLSISRFDEQLRRIGLLSANTEAMLNIRIADPGINLLETGGVPADLQNRPLTLMARSATSGKSGDNVEGYRDYRGVPVVGAWTWDDELQFGIVSELDVREAYRTLHATRRTIAALAMLAIALVFGLTATYLSYRRRVLAEEALLVSRERYRRLIEDLQDDYLLYSCDPDGKFSYVSPSAKAIFGLCVNTLRGGDWQALVDMPPATHRAIDHSNRMCRMGRKPEAFDLHYRHPGGRSRVLEVRDRPVIDEQGRVIAIEGIAKDITDRARVASELRQARDEAERANAGKSRFLAAASHDLRQPLHALNLLNTSLEKKLRSKGEAAIVRKQRRMLASMGDIVNSLLDINQLESGVVVPEIREFRVADILTDLYAECSEAASEKGLALHVVPCSAAIRSDPGLLRVILRNLISNAVKYTRQGKVLIGCRRRGDCLRIEIWDTGIGIPASERKRVFEDFYQLDNAGRDRGRGHGLGLAIVQRLCRLLDHPLELRSTPGRGTGFAVSVPLGDDQAKPREAVGGAEPDAVRTDGVVLYIEDDPAIVDAVRMLLELEGIHVVVANSGSEAMRLVDKEHLRPHLVVADYRLAAGVTGLEVILELRRRLGRLLPALIVTGEIRDNVVDVCARRGIDVLLKPVNTGRLVRTIHGLMNSDSAASRVVTDLTTAGQAPVSS